MTSLKVGGIIGSGGLGVLIAGLLVSEILNLGVSGIIAVAFLLYVMAGAGSLLLRNI